MTLPASGAISLNAVNIELQRSGTASLSMNDADLRSLFGVASGQISMSSGYSKTWITSGSNDYGTAGTYTWTSPARGWNTLTVQAWGGGGGGSGVTNNDNTTAGGQSSFNATIIANGGGRATYNGVVGAGGTASGGSTNTTGGAGTAWNNTTGGVGGSSPNGGAGGARGIPATSVNGGDGGYPGGGGGAGVGAGVGAGGGGGGYSTISYTNYTTIAKNTGYTVVVGARGTQATGGGLSLGGNGAVGRVLISWS